MSWAGDDPGDLRQELDWLQLLGALVFLTSTFSSCPSQLCPAIIPTPVQVRGQYSFRLRSLFSWGPRSVGTPGRREGHA